MHGFQSGHPPTLVNISHIRSAGSETSVMPSIGSSGSPWPSSMVIRGQYRSNRPNDRGGGGFTVPCVAALDERGGVEEVASRFWAAINNQDLDELTDVCDEEMELHSVVGSVYRGHE